MALIHRTKRHGGGIIKWKLFMAMFLLCGVALLNLSDASASSVNSTNSSVPHVTAVDPSNNAVNVQVNKVINVTFSEPIKEGTNWIELQNSNGTLISINTSIKDNVLTVTPNNNLTKGTKYLLLIHTGSVTDKDGNSVSPYVARFSTDGTAPTVKSSDPSNNAAVLSNKVIKVTFGEAIKAGTNWIELQGSNGALVPISTSISGNVLTITPNNNLTNGIKYSVLIHTGSVKDLAGNNVKGYVTRFTTDGTAPTVKSSDPSNKAVDVLLNKVIKVTFGEAIKTGTNWIELQNSNGTIIPTSTSISGNVLTVTPLSNLSEETNYVLLIHTGSVTDLAGNNVKGYVTRFRTDTPFNQAAFNQIMRTASKFGYCSGISTAAGIAKCCRGDCWAMSAYLFQRLSAANITCRIEQYSTSSASRHRSVQYLLNGSWVNVPYAAWGFNWNFRNTANIKYGCTIAQS
jgi:methionine-rich copper-binding protein CopC